MLGGNRGTEPPRPLRPARRGGHAGPAARHVIAGTATSPPSRRPRKAGAAPAAGLEAIRQAVAQSESAPQGGWTIHHGLGEYGTDYANRAIVALVRLGANLAADAVYPHATTDADGQPLTGQHRYLLHFDADQLPPVRGFWSLSMYNDKQFFVDNPLGRYAIGDRDDLRANPDGSLDIHIQQQSPGPSRSPTGCPPRPATSTCSYGCTGPSSQSWMAPGPPAGEAGVVVGVARPWSSNEGAHGGNRTVPSAAGGRCSMRAVHLERRLPKGGGSTSVRHHR